MNKKQTKEVEKLIAHKIDYAQKDIKNLRKATKMIAQGKYHWRINLISLWANEGEDGIQYNAPIGESLSKAVKIADKKFMIQNNRSDVQANQFAHLIIEDEKGETLESISFEHPDETDKRRERHKRKSNLKG